MTCPALVAGGASPIADGLRAVDCMSAEASATAFSRLFGGSGALTGALTVMLTLYIGLYAFSLLTGRGGLSLSALTPRMTGLGLALTFATSWAAYQNVIWSLLSGGPDQIAAILIGAKGSASQAFAQRLDVVFAAVADAAERAIAAQGEAKKATSPGDLLSYAAMLLLLGTAGVLVTARVALAALLAVGPVFIILALFPATRGLFEGWLKAAVMVALVPLFTVLIGAGALAMLNPVIASLASGEPDLAQAATVFVAACIHCSLMFMVLNVVSALTSGWRMGRSAPVDGPVSHAGQFALPHPVGGPVASSGPLPGNSLQGFARDPRISAIVDAAPRAAPADSRICNVVRAAPSTPGQSRAAYHTMNADPASAATGPDRTREITRGLRSATVIPIHRKPLTHRETMP